MKKKIVAFGLICLLSAFPASAKLFDISEYTLSNGARLLVVENHKAPIVKHMVWYRVGRSTKSRARAVLPICLNI